MTANELMINKFTDTKAHRIAAACAIDTQPCGCYQSKP